MLKRQRLQHRKIYSGELFILDLPMKRANDLFNNFTRTSSANFDFFFFTLIGPKVFKENTGLHESIYIAFHFILNVFNYL